MSLVYGCDGRFISWMRGYLVLHPVNVISQLLNAFRYK
jgi:hypothetical protein